MEKEVIVIVKRLEKIEYTFRMRKHYAGLNTISNVPFDSPDSDGIKISSLLRELPEGQILTVTLTVEEE